MVKGIDRVGLKSTLLVALRASVWTESDKTTLRKDLMSYREKLIELVLQAKDMGIYEKEWADRAIENLRNMSDEEIVQATEMLDMLVEEVKGQGHLH